jgi:hypothetical protein
MKTDSKIWALCNMIGMQSESASLDTAVAEALSELATLQEKDAEIARLKGETRAALRRAEVAEQDLRVAEILKVDLEAARLQRHNALAERAALRAELERLKPSGQVKEDANLLADLVGPPAVICSNCGHPPHKGQCDRDHETYSGECLCSVESTEERNHAERAALSRLATRAQAAQAKDETIKVLAEALRNLRCVAVSQGVSEQHGVIINADTALAGVLK